MHQTEIEYRLLRLIKIGIFATLLTPLILGPFGLNLAEYPKAVFFRCIVEVIFVLYLFLILLDKKYLPKKSVLLWSLLIFYAVMFVASIFGINFFRSFFGDLQRGEGLITHLHLLAFFVISISIFSEKKDWLNLFKISAIISGISSVAAILQQLKVFTFYGMYLPSLSGTLSNSDLFGDYMVLSIFIIIFLLVLEKKRWFKILWSFLIILNCYTLFFSGTRGAWLGLVAGLIPIVLFNFFRLNYKKKIYIASVTAVLCLLVLLAFINLQWFRNMPANSVLHKMTSFDLNGRAPIWQAAIEAFTKKPIIGWGFESFAFVSDKYSKSGIGNGVYFDRAHNKILELLVYGGVLGLLSYLLIFSAIFYLIFKYAKVHKNHNSWPQITYASILTGFFIAYFVQNIFSFDNICTFILFFLVAGFINNSFYYFSEDGILEEEPSQDPKFSGRELALKSGLMLIAALIMIWIMYVVNIKPTIAAMYFPNSMTYENTDIAKAFYGYKQGISINTIYDSDLRLAFADRSLYLLETGSADSIKGKVLDALSKINPFLQKDIKNKDEQVNHLYEYVARIYEWQYLINKNPQALDQMDNTLKEAVSFNPDVSEFYELSGELLILQDKNVQGEESVRKSCKLDPASCVNDTELYRRIAVAYMKKGDIKNAAVNFQKILDADYSYKTQTSKSAITFANPGQFTDYVAILYCRQLKDLSSCQNVYKKGSEAYPEYADIFKQHSESLTAEFNSNQ